MLLSLGRVWRVAVAALVVSHHVEAVIDLDITSVDSLKSASGTAAYQMMSYYTGNQTGQIPGKIPNTWWEGGAMFMALFQYWHWTGDTSYNNVTTQGMLWQAGDNADYMPSNWSRYLGNDDQVFWGFAAMTAAELKFPDVPDSPSWLGLAQAVFNTQADRWDDTFCGGGLRWQLYPYQLGYTSKNTISNGGFFQLAARLARYTNNATYADWAKKTWDWTATTPLFNESSWYLNDIIGTDSNCTTNPGRIQWTYNYGTFLMGAAYMYNYTNGSAEWGTAVDGLLETTLTTFFPQQYGGKIMSEIACEGRNNCNNDQKIFKGLLSGWLAFTSLLVPNTTARIMPVLEASAQAAAKACTGTPTGNICGQRWYQASWDGMFGLEEAMSVLNVIQSNLVTQDKIGPVKASTGGTSKTNPGQGRPESDPGSTTPATTGDKAGASILTVLILGGMIAVMTWMVK